MTHPFCSGRNPAVSGVQSEPTNAVDSKDSKDDESNWFSSSAQFNASFKVVSKFGVLLVSIFPLVILIQAHIVTWSALLSSVY